MKTTIVKHQIRADVADVFPFFADFEKFGEAHPLFTKIEKTSDNEAIIHERVKLLGFIPYNFQYKGKMTVIEPNTLVVMVAQPQHNVHLELRFEFSQQGDYTQILEHIGISAPFWLNGITRKMVTKSHQLLAKAVEQLLNKQ